MTGRTCTVCGLEFLAHRDREEKVPEWARHLWQPDQRPRTTTPMLPAYDDAGEPEGGDVA